MMTKKGKILIHSKNREAGSAPILNISKIGIVSRDYRKRFQNRYRDFSHALPDLLKLLDRNKCDAVLFSLFSIVPRESYDPRVAFKNLKNIKAIFIEEFQDVRNREAGRYVVYYRASSEWKEYHFYQVFGTITGMPKRDIEDFVTNEMPKRILGNSCVLLCGETNGVKYSKQDKKVHDNFNLRATIPKNVNIVLNPIHDLMTRFEMKLKRQFLSKNQRWVISVWNKGRQDKNGRVKDGKGPAWTVFYNGKEKELKRMPNDIGVEVGILNIKRA